MDVPAADVEQAALPTPNFEGSEKRVEIDFFPPSFSLRPTSQCPGGTAATVALAAAVAGAAENDVSEHVSAADVAGGAASVSCMPSSASAADLFLTPSASLFDISALDGEAADDAGNAADRFAADSAADAAGSSGSFRGLRALPRESLDELMSLAACCIVSSRSNEHLDAYVLSESSLFVYQTKWVLKTCGTTKLLNAIPRLLEMAAELGMSPRRAKYSRASFLFPEQQPFPYTGFEHEVAFLQSHFGTLGNAGGQAYRLGEEAAGLQWHIYLAEAETVTAKSATTSAVHATECDVGVANAEELGVPAAASVAEPLTFNLEVCMTELAPECAAQFVRCDAFVSAAQTTTDSGIGALKPSALIDDYVFEPCGYSMNGIDGSGLMTIHITPEAGQSYASLEVSGFAADMLQPAKLLAAAVKIFRAGKLAVALSVSGQLPATSSATDDAPADATAGAAAAARVVEGCDSDAESVTANWGVLSDLPAGYGCVGATMQQHGVGRVTFYTLSHGEGKAAPTPGSPDTALQYGSFLSVDADSDDNNSSLGDA